MHDDRRRSPTLACVEFRTVEALRERHAAWRLLRATSAPLILTFLGDFFVEANRGPTPASLVAAALDDVIYDLDAADADTSRFPRKPTEYLDEWASDETGYLRRFYPTDGNEVHYEVTPAFEKAYAWVASLAERSFVGTESRLHTVVELLRQIVHGTETDPAARLAELHRRRDEIDAQIAAAEAGELDLLDSTGVRDRYQQFAATARELLADFREVEENFRRLDRAAREKIATFTGAKGDLLADLVGTQSDIATSDQGRSFQAFYEYLLSQRRQDELADLLATVAALPDVDPDPRMAGIRGHWSQAAERTQRTVRQISEQLRRFLDDQVWLENRRVVDLVRGIESAALALRGQDVPVGLVIDVPGIDIALPLERPLYRRTRTPPVISTVAEATDTADPALLFAQTYVDYSRLATNIRSVVPRGASADLADLVALFPIEQGAAEIVGYLTLAEPDLEAGIDDTKEDVIDYTLPAGETDGEGGDVAVRARLPHVTLVRR